MTARTVRRSAAALAVAVVLFAPACSDETKNDIKKVGSDLSSEANSKGSDLSSSASSLSDSLSSDNSSSSSSNN